jgi:hypothetical protein
MFALQKTKRDGLVPNKFISGDIDKKWLSCDITAISLP